MTLLNSTASRAAKRAGQQIALDCTGNWPELALHELRGWLAARKAAGIDTMTIEEFRADCATQPDSHKAWGALPKLAVKAGLIRPLVHADGSPVMRAAQAARTHAHPVRCWGIQ